MKLTREQRSELISEMASSEAGFNELVRVLLDSFSKPMVSAPVVGGAMVGVSNFASLVRAPMLFNLSFLVFYPLRRVSARSFFTSCIPVDSPVKTLPRWGVASTVTFIVNSR